MAIFNSYVSLPEGKGPRDFIRQYTLHTMNKKGL